MHLALRVAGSIFGLVALMHVTRLAFHIPVVFGGCHIPVRASAVGAIVSAVLSFWMFRASLGKEAK